jgi:predicted DNA-binding protein (MmcQ/YjbR family)
MDLEAFRNYCLAKPGVTESMPFGNDTLVFKVVGKIFALAGIDEFKSINLKADPEIIPEWRESYPAVQPGYHMNKKHWNTVILDGSISEPLIFSWINHSYEQVVKKLPSRQRKELQYP